MERDNYFMRIAIRQAKTAKTKVLPPIGAIITKDNVVVSYAHNNKDIFSDATAHAEILAIRKAGKKIGPNLNGCNLYVTLQPCLMCLAGCYWAHIDNIYYGLGREADEKYFVTKKDFTRQILNDLVLRKIKIKGGLLKEECKKLYE